MDGAGATRGVLVVDDHRAFADAVSLAISIERDLRCIDTVGTAEAAFDVIAGSSPDVVLLDLGLPRVGGIETITILRERWPDLRIVVLTANTSAETVIAAIEAGADAFLPKEQPFATVVAALRGDDTVALDPATVAEVLRAASSHPASGSPPAPDLTDREYQVLVLLSEGLACKTVARRVGISVNTCRGHIRSLLVKLDATSQLQAVMNAARAGILPGLYGDG